MVGGVLVERTVGEVLPALRSNIDKVMTVYVSTSLGDIVLYFVLYITITMLYIVLYCTVLYCIVLYCTVLYCIVHCMSYMLYFVYIINKCGV